MSSKTPGSRENVTLDEGQHWGRGKRFRRMAGLGGPCCTPPGPANPRLQLEAAARPWSLGDVYLLVNDGRVIITLMKNSLRARASQTAMRKPGGISEPPVTQAECAARGGPRDSRVASPAPRAHPAPPQERGELRPPAGFPPPSHRQSQSPTATLGQALG